MSEEDLQGELELSGLIKKIRSELLLAQEESEDPLIVDAGGVRKKLRFDIDDIELEVDVVASGKLAGGMAARLFVLTPKVKAQLSEVTSQKITMRLKPVRVDDN